MTRADGTDEVGRAGVAAVRTGWRGLAAALPGAGSLLLPMGACPACWPAYAGFLSSLGLGFLLEGWYLAPLLAGLLLFALGSLAYRAGERRGYGPFVVGLTGAAVAIAGKFALAFDPLIYLGFAALVGAAGWNAWPLPTSRSCAKCTPQGALTTTDPSARNGELP